MAEIVELEECAACAGGWGHEVDMTDGYECRFRCRVCREVQVIDARDETECCDHRYVGEDLWRAEYASDVWTCPVCSGTYGAHDMDCGYFVCDCGGTDGEHDPDCEYFTCEHCGMGDSEHSEDCESLS